jgi:hypothetical protein
MRPFPGEDMSGVGGDQRMVVMRQSVVHDLGSVLEPEQQDLVRKAYFAAISRLGLDDSDFAHIWPPRLDTRLARLVIRLATGGHDDPISISSKALSTLKALPRRESRCGQRGKRGFKAR